MKNINKLTANGAKAYSSTQGGAVLDLFSCIGTLRNDTDKAVSMWRAARNEDKELADNLILYTRDIRNTGIGERALGKALLKELAKVDPRKVARNFDTIVSAGRWDDLFIFIGTPLEDEVIDFIKEAWLADAKAMAEGKPISLLAKWMPSINTSSASTRALAKKIARRFNLKERTYRKSLSAMRKYTNVVEVKMSAREWDSIDFETVPSVAMNRYQKAFERNASESFNAYRNALVKGEAKINASTLFPYDICQKFFTSKLTDVDEAAWKALPNYIRGDYDVVVMADISGSMTCDRYKPIATSVGLATYFAQHNTGAYKNLYMTFSGHPSFINITNKNSLEDIFEYVSHQGMGYNTNLDSAFNKVYDKATETGEVPRAFIVISDNEIDGYVNERSSSIISKWDKKFKVAGFEGLPKVIFWNASSMCCGKPTMLAKAYENISYISGCSASQFAHLDTLINKSAYQAMIEILTLPAFAWK